MFDPRNPRRPLLPGLNDGIKLPDGRVISNEEAARVMAASGRWYPPLRADMVQLPDGRVVKRTDETRPTVLSNRNPQPASPPARPKAPAGTNAGTWSLSAAGATTIRGHEGFGANVYQPTGGSGVTLGYGYDMKDRSQNAVYKDLISVGLDNETAMQMSQGAGKFGRGATDFVKRYGSTPVIEEDKALNLFRKDTRAYEDVVQNLVKVPLNQNQYDALVSLVYNIGGPHFEGSTVLKRLNAGDYENASKAFMMWVKSKGQFVKGLENRRKQEVALFNKAVG